MSQEIRPKLQWSDSLQINRDACCMTRPHSRVVLCELAAMLHYREGNDPICVVITA